MKNQPGTMPSGLSVSMRLVESAFRPGLRRAKKRKSKKKDTHKFLTREKVAEQKKDTHKFLTREKVAVLFLFLFHLVIAKSQEPSTISG